MPTDKKIEEAIKPLVEMYSNIETDLLKEIASHFLVGKEFENADYYRIQKLEEMGAFNQCTIEYLASKTGVTQDKIKECLENIGISTFDSSELSKLYKNGTIKVDPSTLKDNIVIQSMINNAYNDMSKHFIELSSKIEQSTREAYLKVLEESYLDASMGTHSYDGAIRKAINALSNEGIKTVTYKTTDDNGNVTGIRSYDIEGLVRRDALTGARQLSGQLNNELIRETECKYVKFSEHLDCRETHYPWQGTIVKTSKWKEIAKYGDITGIYGINCRHYVEPYFGDKRGKEEKTYSQEKCDNAYAISQKQRYLERGIRKWKRKKEMFRVNGDKQAYNISKEKVNNWSNRLENFTKNNARRRDFSREYVGKSKYTSDEIKSLNYYISPTSITLNEKLRNYQSLDAMEQNIVNNLDRALEKTANYEGNLVRVMQLDNPKDFTQQLKIGEIFKTNQYLSFSNKEGYNNKANVKIYVPNSKNGKDLLKINKIGENEVLYQRNKQFRTLNIQENNGIIYVLWEEM